MVETSRQLAAKFGHPPARIYFEKFAPAPAILKSTSGSKDRVALR
jgi:hypothetical protein